MARTQTLLSLRTQARQRADRENSAFVSDAEVSEFINQSWAEAYEVISDSGEDYYLKSQAISTISGTGTYALPSDHYKTRGVDVTASSGIVFPAKRFTFAERDLYQAPGFWTFGEPLSYATQGTNLALLPVPGAVYAVTLWYYPAPARMVGDTDTIDGVAGWEEFAVLDAALKILAKEGKAGEPNGLTIKAERDGELARIRSKSSSRDAGAAPRIFRSRYLRRTSPRWR